MLCAGAEPAGPGEFTKRAYLNGKIGLAQAEAVMSIVAAQGEQAAQAALHALEGSLAKKLRFLTWKRKQNVGYPTKGKKERRESIKGAITKISIINSGR